MCPHFLQSFAEFTECRTTHHYVVGDISPSADCLLNGFHLVNANIKVSHLAGVRS